MALTGEKADEFFNENQVGFEAICRLFITVAHSADLELFGYLCTCIERVANLTLEAMKQGQKPKNISWH